MLFLAPLTRGGRGGWFSRRGEDERVGFSQCALIGGGLVVIRRDLIMREKALDEFIRSGRANREEARTNRDEFLKSS